jgi:UDPglucose 6-dehydrogenase
VTKSTVPVGTGAKLLAHVRTKFPERNLHLASNPEFLREGSAVDDFMKPDRIVIGCENKLAEEKLRALYQPLTALGAPLIATSLETAECIKYAANSFLAVKLSYINELANLCEKTNADVSVVAEAIGADPRIGKSYLKVGPGYGGYCLPKDTLALAHTARENQVQLHLVEAAIAANKNRKKLMLEKISAALSDNLKNKKIALIGLSFKAGTDDLREAISLYLVPELLAAGAHLQLFDPIITTENLVKFLPDFSLPVTNNIEESLADAELAVVLIEWTEFQNFPWSELAKKMSAAKILDLRNVLSGKKMREMGFEYQGIGGVVS